MREYSIAVFFVIAFFGFIALIGVITGELERDFDNISIAIIFSIVGVWCSLYQIKSLTN